MTTVSEITNFVVYDDLMIERTIEALPSGQLVTKAWFTVKRHYTDDDTAALISKEITSIVSANGIVDSDTLQFYLSDDDTGALTPLAEYRYSIKMVFNNGQKYTPETGTIIALPAVKQGVT